jgi:hypothetical protein
MHEKCGHPDSKKKHPYKYVFSTFGSKIKEFEKIRKNEKIPKT